MRSGRGLLSNLGPKIVITKQINKIYTLQEPHVSYIYKLKTHKLFFNSAAQSRSTELETLELFCETCPVRKFLRQAPGSGLPLENQKTHWKTSGNQHCGPGLQSP